MKDIDPYAIDAMLAGDFDDPIPDQSDAELALEVAGMYSSECVQRQIARIDLLVEDRELKWQLIADFANRHFEDSDSCKEWLKMIRDQFQVALDRRSRPK